MSAYIEEQLTQSLLSIEFTKNVLNQNHVHSLMSGILSAYANRPYHGISHIEKMLRDLRQTTEYTPKNAPALVLAIIYHDIVYDVQSSINEYESTKYFSRAMSSIGIPPDIESDVIYNIMATKHDGKRWRLQTDQSKIIHDLDLLVFADPYEELVKSNALVEQEYMQVFCPEDVYTGRRNFLIDFVKSPLYVHPNFVHLNYMAENNIRELIEEYERHALVSDRKKVSPQSLTFTAPVESETYNSTTNVILRNE